MLLSQLLCLSKEVLDVVSDLTLKKTYSAFLLISFWISLMRKNPELLGRTVIGITTNYNSQLLTHANQGFLNIMKPKQIQK